ncbi:MAG TPA: hypothetical protein VFV81_04675 [Verrucomicrobiae bacterium]|nr:hypothetical protein [Verrucomicrobiae bacterium]
MLAPVCPQCHCRIIGSGVEQGDQLFCSDQCAFVGKRFEFAPDCLRQPYLSVV